jgi:penicillin-binding protein 1A
MAFWRHIFPFDRRRKKGRGHPMLEARNVPQRRTADQPSGSRYPRYRSTHRRKKDLKPVLKRVALGGGGIIVLYIGWIYFTLPDINSLNKFTKAPSILIKSEDGQIIGSFGDIYGDYIPFSELPSSLIDAVIATEDRNFYHHFGIDPLGLLRAGFADIRARHVVQGGSTITQQVAKNVFLTPERSFSRKIREMMLAIKLERRFSKQDILSIYLNRVYLGAGNYGVDAASKRYFEKSGRELTLSESAIIAGLLKAPSRFAPTSNSTLALKRADQVLVNMEEAGYLSEQQTVKAREDLAKTMSGNHRSTQSTLYFADWIADQLPEYVGNVQEDLVVTATIKPSWQLLAEKAVTDIMDKEGADHDASQAALVSMSTDGAVRAMIGGRSYAKSQFNRATQSLRQPGSSFKLFVYLTALEAGWTPGSMVEDKPISVPIVGGMWSPNNYNQKFLGPMTLKDAVTESVNTVAVQVAESVGLNNIIAMARRLGITSDLEAVPSIALGSTEVTLIELTAAYGHLAAQGEVVYPYGIIAITTSKGDPVYVRQTSGDGFALAPHIVGEMNEMLMSVVENGTGKAARIGRPIAGKTGTTSDYRDAWFVGFTPQLVTGVWVGNDDNSEMKKVTGGMLPAQIWHEFMAAATASMPVENIPTDGGSRVSLPWQQQGPPAYPQQPDAAQQPQTMGPPMPAEAPKDEHKEGKGAVLGPNFWHKLFGR